MNKFMRMAAFRCLNADEGDGSGGGAASEDFDLGGLAESAYEAATADPAPAAVDGVAPPSADDVDDSLTPEDDEPPAADDGAQNPDDVADPLALSADFVASNPDVAKVYGEQVASLQANVEAVKPFLAFQEQLGDPALAPDALRGFIESVAKHHGQDVSTFLGMVPVAVTPPAATEPDWRALGFESKDSYDAAPEWEQHGFDSPNELRLHREVEALTALITPTIEATKASAEAAQKAAAQSRFEAAVKTAAPAALAALKAEHGWAATEAQAIEAATRFPQLAATDLKTAILSAFPLELVKHYKTSAAGVRPAMPEIPNGGDGIGLRVPDPNTATFAQLAEFAYSQLG